LGLPEHGAGGASVVLHDVGKLVRDETSARNRVGRVRPSRERDVRPHRKRICAELPGGRHRMSICMHPHLREVCSECRFELAPDARVEWTGASRGTSRPVQCCSAIGRLRTG